MQKKLTGILVILCFHTLLIKAQSFKISEDEFKFKEFPRVEFKFWTRSVTDIEKNKFILKENDIHINEVLLQPVSDINQKQESKNKILFILIENHYLAKGIIERTFFKNILAKGIQGCINQGDKVFVGTFDWFRDNKYVFLQSGVPTDNENTIINQIKSISAPPALKNQQVGSDIYFALDETLGFLSKLKDTLPRNILLLSDDYPNIASQKTVDEVRNSSIKSDIPIYAIGYNIGAERYSQITKNEICLLTNGAYFSSSVNDQNACADKVGEFINSMNNNSLGKMYSATFISKQKKTGQQVKIGIGLNDKNLETVSVKYPFNLFDWIKENVILSICVLAGLIALVVLIFILIKRRKKQKILNIISEQEKELQLRHTEEEIERLKLQQLGSDEKLKDQKLQFEDEARLERLKKLMKAKGVTPRVTYDYNGQKGQFFIDSPKYTFGRDEKSNSFHISVNSVSRNHAEIDFNENGQFTIKDLNSTNGVIVNGNKVATAVLKHADIIKLGDVTLKIHL